MTSAVEISRDTDDTEDIDNTEGTASSGNLNREQFVPRRRLW